MNYLKKILLSLAIATLGIFISCSEDDPGIDETVNENPIVANALDDLSLNEGFGTEVISLVDVFSDAETMMLVLSASSAETSVVSVAVDRGELTITEVGLGMSTITVTATDEDGASASDQFVVTVAENGTTTCTNDNSIATDLGTCDKSPTVANVYDETTNGNTRVISTNGIPNHDFSNQNPMANELNSGNKSYQVAAAPSKSASTTSILTGENRPKTRFGVALNGVAIDPAPAEPFIFTITGGQNDGEYNWDWVFEPTNNTGAVGLDCAQAHVQPDGTYHYHGDMVEYANTIEDGLGDGTFIPTVAIQVGWAADGFPILYKYGPDASGNVRILDSSYRLKSGDRPGDGNTEPCGTYNGKYTNDYEYVAGAGDLDECNGVDRSITIDGETFSYFYVITDMFPVVSRCFVGSPDSSFNLGM